MTASLYLTRARLRRDPSVAAIAPLLLPEDASPRAGALHRLVWSLFAGDPDARRDFLWREDKNSTFFTLSPRPPAESLVFETETKEFAPALLEGDHLRFSLRANATRSIKAPGATQSKRADVVMAALKDIPPARRNEVRPGIIIEAGRTWLEAQGARNGFSLAENTALRVDGYTQLKMPRAGASPISISLMDFEGVLTVTDPARFLLAVAQGFGHAKAFGCGLMMIRRV